MLRKWSLTREKDPCFGFQKMFFSTSIDSKAYCVPRGSGHIGTYSECGHFDQTNVQT